MNHALAAPGMKTSQNDPKSLRSPDLALKKAHIKFQIKATELEDWNDVTETKRVYKISNINYLINKKLIQGKQNLQLMPHY